MPAETNTHPSGESHAILVHPAHRLNHTMLTMISVTITRAHGTVTIIETRGPVTGTISKARGSATLTVFEGHLDASTSFTCCLT